MRSLTILIIIFLSNLICYIYGIPADPNVFTHMQADGSIIELKLYGDEFAHYYMTNDSVPVFLKDDGHYYYGNLNFGEIEVSSILAHDFDKREVFELEFVKHIETKKLLHEFEGKNQNQRLVRNAERINRIAKKATLGKFRNYIGDFKSLVVLVEFPDLPMSSQDAKRDFEKLFNQKGYSDYGSEGSVRDYFYDQSYGKFNLSFDVVGPVMMERNHGYYGYNDAASGNDKHVKELIIEALKLVDSDVNFRDYDWDKDGEVDIVYIIYAGYGESSGGASNTIWPHESSISSADVTFDGVKISTYACSNELRGHDGEIRTGIGTICHEFSHSLGFPDLYDTDYSGAYGMGYWDVMHSGSYNGPDRNGEVPYGYSAFEKWQAGWLSPTVIGREQHNMRLEDIQKKPQSYVIYNDNNENEFYIVENHQAEKWYKYVGKNTGIHGMMVTHINYDAKAWLTNRVNPTSENQRVSIIPADNEYSYSDESYRNDLFPGPLNVMVLDDFSHKETGGFLYNPNIDGKYLMHKCLVDIEEGDDGVINFGVFFNNEFSAPEPMAAIVIDNSGYIAIWKPVERADYYIVEQIDYDYWGDVMIPLVRYSNKVTSTYVNLKWQNQNNKKSRYRVKAVAHGVESGWSKNMEVNGEILTSGMDKSVEEDNDYLIFGSDGIRRSSLQKGLNIIQTSRGTEKVIIR